MEPKASGTNTKRGFWKTCGLILLFLFGVFAGRWASKTSSNEAKQQTKDQPEEEMRLKENYKYINPLLECDTTESHFKTLEPLQEKVATYITSQIASKKTIVTGVYYRELNTGAWFGVDIPTAFAPASLLKIPLMMAYFKLAETNPQILNQELVYTGKEAQEALNQDFGPQTALEINKKYSILELIKYMISDSNNLAYIMLFNNINTADVERTYKDLGVTLEEQNAMDRINIITPRKYAKFFRILYNASYLTKNYSEKPSR